MDQLELEMRSEDPRCVQSFALLHDKNGKDGKVINVKLVLIKPLRIKYANVGPGIFGVFFTNYVCFALNPP